MPSTTACPACSRSLRVPDELIGQSVKCPSCGEVFTAAVSRDSSYRDVSDRPARRPAPPSEEDDEDHPSPRRFVRRDEDDEDDDLEIRRRRRRLAPHRGDMIQILGILGFIPVFPFNFVIGPMAWVMGNGDLAEMKAGRMDPEGRSRTETGRLCGKIATIIHLCLLSVPLAIFAAYMGCCCIFGIGGATSAGAGGMSPGPTPIRQPVPPQPAPIRPAPIPPAPIPPAPIRPAPVPPPPKRF